MEENVKLVPRDRTSLDLADLRPIPGTVLPMEMTAREPHLRDYLVIVQKHQWIILAFLLTLVTVVTIASFRMQPVYEAVTRVAIDKETQSILPFQDTSWDAYLDMENYIETQAKIMQSETLALKTIDSLDLGKYPEFGGKSVKVISAAGGKGGKPALEDRPGILGDFLSRLSVKRVLNSRLLDVRFEAHDPRLATQVVNAHVQNYIEENFKSKYEATLAASNWLARQLDDLKIKVEKAEDARVAYERNNQIWTIDDKQNITTQKLSDLNKELTEAQSDRIQKESIYQLVRAGDLDAISAVRENLVTQELVKKQTGLTTEYTEALGQFGPKYPKVIRLQTQLKEVDQLIARERRNIASGIASEYRAAVQRERLFQQALEKQKEETNQLAEKLVQYNILKREAEGNKQLYEGLQQKLKEAGISAGLRSNNIRVVDPALVPPSPSRPQKLRNIFLAFVVGLVGGIGLAFLREYLDNTVKSPDDVESLTRLPSLAVVPMFGASNSRGRVPKMLKGATVRPSGSRVELVSHEHPQSQISEAFRALRTSLLLSQAEHAPQVILVASPLPKEGKTTAALNLAVTLAQLGDRTILVDSDLRKPSIGRALGLTDGKYSGLSTYLAGASSLELVTVPHPVIKNLSVIPTGPIPPNPAELLSSKRLQQAIETLRAEYRFIVVDSPPMLAATDAVILSVISDGVVLVVRSGETPKAALSRVKDLLVGVRSRVLGVVLNAVDVTSPDYYYSYQYYPYDYGYGEKAAPPGAPRRS